MSADEVSGNALNIWSHRGELPVVITVQSCAVSVFPYYHHLLGVIAYTQNKSLNRYQIVIMTQIHHTGSHSFVACVVTV